MRERAAQTPLIASEDRLPSPRKTMFCAGVAVEHIGLKMTRYTLWMPFFNIGLGIPAAKLGMILMILCAWDAFIHPIMGNITDNARTRWGRRRPFIFAGALLTAIVFPFLWNVPAIAGKAWAVPSVIGIGLLLGVCMTCWAMPYYGMQLELTPNYDERTRISAGMALTGRIISLLGGWTLALISGPWFADAATGRPDLVHGMRTCSWFMALPLLALGVLPALFLRERLTPAQQRHMTRESLWTGLRQSIHCAPLLRLIGMSFFLQLGSVSVQALTLYVNIHVVTDGSVADASLIAGWRSTAMFIIGVAGIPAWIWLGEKFDKTNMAAWMLGIAAAGHLLNLVCLRPELPYLQLLPMTLESFAIGALWVYVPSMKADIADYDELQTGLRREGSLNAFHALFMKLALMCALGLGGLLIQFARIDETLVTQPAAVVNRLKYIFIFLPIFFWGVSAWCMLRYRLNRPVMAGIRRQLEERRGQM